MHDTELQQQLQSLCDEPEFRNLRATLDRFDPFKVLQVERQELRHTTTLAWLLDPEQSHGLGERFLRRFLEAACGADGSRIAIGDQALDGRVAVQPEQPLSGAKLRSQATVEDSEGEGKPARKTGELDVLIESETWAVAIEAKIDSKEGRAQLSDYSDYLEERFRDGKTLVRLYLTVRPEPEVIARNPEWHAIQWGRHVLDALRATLQEADGQHLGAHRPMATPDKLALHEFLHGYKSLLERLEDTLHGVGDQVQRLADAHYATLAALKEQLPRRKGKTSPFPPWSASPSWAGAYWRNRGLLGILLERLRSPEASFTASIVQRLAAAGGTPLSYLSAEDGARATVRFVPESWLRLNVTAGGRSVPLHTLMYYHVALRDSKQNRDIEIKLHLPKSGDQLLQVELVTRLLVQAEARQAKYVTSKSTELGDFLARATKSLKLYSDKLKWQMSESAYQLQAGVDEQIPRFWLAVEEHTCLLEQVLSAQQPAPAGEAPMAQAA